TRSDRDWSSDVCSSDLDMGDTCTAPGTLLTCGLAFMIGFLLLLSGGMGHAAEAPNEILVGATLPLSGRFTPMAGTFDRLCQSWRSEERRVGKGVRAGVG